MEDVPFGVVASIVYWRHCRPSEWSRVLAVFHELRQHLVPVQVNKLLGNDFISKLFFQYRRVGLADPKSNCAADISEDRLADGQGKLIDILM